MRQSVDAAGALVAAREWTPYGVEVGEAQAGLGFTGEWFDAAVGLQYLRARWYHPGTGRFTQEDPLHGIPQQPATQHRYKYVAANPINYSDPRGLWYGPDQYDAAGIETCEEQDLFWREYCRVFPNDCGLYGTPVPIPIAISPSAFYWPVSSGGQYDQWRDKCFKNRMLGQLGRELMHRWEGWRSHMYDDGGPGVGNCTIGWGHLIHLEPCTPSCRLCQTPEDCLSEEVQCLESESPFCGGITRDEGDRLFTISTQQAVNKVNDEIEVPVSQEQFDALVSFAFNRGQLGAGTSGNTDIRPLINQYRFVEAAQVFQEYVTAYNIEGPLPGLVSRRRDEAQLFNAGYYNSRK